MKRFDHSSGLILVVGCKGGVGATTVAVELFKAAPRGVPLDLADGQMIARLDKAAWLLSTIVFEANQQPWIERVVKKRPALFWTPECALAESGWSFVRALADRLVVVADGGLSPPEGLVELAETCLIVTAEDDAAHYHTRRLQKLIPHALLVSGAREAARDLAAQWWGKGQGVGSKE